MEYKSYLDKYLEYCRYRKELDSKTIKAYRIDLNQFFKAVCNETPGREEIEAYITQLHKDFKQRTVKRKIASIKAFYTFLEDIEVLEDNPFYKIKIHFKEIKELPKIIPKHDIEKLLNYMHARNRAEDESEAPGILKDVVVAELLFATGARVHEIVNLRKDCVELQSGVLRIMGKGKRERCVQVVDDAVLNLLKQYYRKFETPIRDSGYFLVNERKQHISEQSVRNMLNKYAKAAGIETHVTPHMFRHSLATYLIEEGADVTCVQKILGHSSITTTQIYVYVAARFQKEVLQKLHPRNKMNII